MKRRSPLSALAESSLTGIARLVIPCFPRKLVVAVSRGVGYLAFRFSRRQRSVARMNLEAILGSTLSCRERDRIALDSFRTMSLLAFDFFWFSVDTERRLRRYVKADPSVTAYLGKGSKIGVAAHFGNWELLGQACSLLSAPVTSVATPLRNPAVDRMVSRVRRVTGQRVVSRQGAIRALLRELRSGGTVALLMDQNTVPADGGVFVDFFGLPVPVSKAVALLCQKTNPDVVFAYCIADRNGTYTAFARDISVRRAADGSCDELTQAVTCTIEQAIREYPGQWMWVYKRWKFVPEGRSLDGYPAYARTIELPEMKPRKRGI